jgi:uncharacterized membrane protein YcaP (DUF421 family)
MYGDRSFAYDLVVRHRPVNSRVVLLLRSIEGKRFFCRLDLYSLLLTLTLGVVKGGDIYYKDSKESKVFFL